MKYLAVLGRQPEISIAELEAVYGEKFHQVFFRGEVLVFTLSDIEGSLKDVSLLPSINRFGGVLKFAIELEQKPIEYLKSLSEGKLIVGVSDYSKVASKKSAMMEALKLKKILVRYGRSVRVVENKAAALSTATSLHNGLTGEHERKVELIKVEHEWYLVIGVQDIDAYAKRDQKRPARDAKVGMLPPKLAQILINLCGPLEEGKVVLDPFCGTGVVLQEALLMGYRAYGTDISERMVEYSKKNLEWLMGWKKVNSRIESVPVMREAHHQTSDFPKLKAFQVSQGDATAFKWQQPIDAVACEGYLGKPFVKMPNEMELKAQKQECKTIVLGFLKNLASQIKQHTPAVMAVPAWLRENDRYERLDILDEIDKLGYNVDNKSREGLLYYRPGQIVARDIIILRKR